MWRHSENIVLHCSSAQQHSLLVSNTHGSLALSALHHSLFAPRLTFTLHELFHALSAWQGK